MQSGECTEWIFTWNYGQRFPDNYVIISGTFDQARTKFQSYFGDNFGYQFPISHEQQVKRAFKKELPLSEAIRRFKESQAR